MNLKVIIIISVVISYSILCFAKDEETRSQVQFKPGLETVSIGNTKIVVPKGSKVYKEGDVIKVEDIGEYSARRFQEMEARVNKLESEIKEILEVLDKLSQKISLSNNNSSLSREGKH